MTFMETGSERSVILHSGLCFLLGYVNRLNRTREGLTNSLLSYLDPISVLRFFQRRKVVSAL